MLPGDEICGNWRRINQNQSPFGLAGLPEFLSQYHQPSIDNISVQLPLHANPSNHHLPPLPPPSQRISSFPSPLYSGGRGTDEEEILQGDERFPQFGIQETKEFIWIRIQLEAGLTAFKSTNSLWELVSANMSEKGYDRTPEQCKIQWEILVHKYMENKEMEGTHVDFSNQFPYFEELNEFFSMQEKQMFLNSEPGSSKLGKRERATGSAQSSEEIYDGGKKIESDEDWVAKGPPVKKKKAKKEKSSDQPNIPANTTSSNALNGLVETLQGFFQQQQKIDMLWMKSMERHAQERALSEQEWRKSMEKLERERLMMENARKEREEQRRSREENRAEKRDALLTALLNKLVHD